MNLGAAILPSTLLGVLPVGILLYLSAELTPAEFTLAIILSMSIIGPVSWFNNAVNDFKSIQYAIKDVNAVLDMPELEESEVPVKLKNYQIELQNVNFSYNDKDGDVLHELSLVVPEDSFTALVGPSGEGKTTMLRLILSLLAPQTGSFHVCAGKNHSNMLDMSPSTRKLFSYVPQGNTMFSGTIAENMRNVKQDATDEEIIEALKLACAWDFVEKLPDGIESVIKERGGGFSEGQAQRLSIARALLRKSPILLLDEATSALDVATERKVLRNIMQDTYPRTCIVTTHRPTVLNICTRVYAIRDKRCEVLGDGEIQKMVKEF